METINGKHENHIALIHTRADDLLDLYSRDVDLLGKLSHGLVGVLVGKGIYVDLHPRGA